MTMTITVQSGIIYSGISSNLKAYKHASFYGGTFFNGTEAEQLGSDYGYAARYRNIPTGWATETLWFTSFEGSHNQTSGIYVTTLTADKSLLSYYDSGSSTWKVLCFDTTVDNISVTNTYTRSAHHSPLAMCRMSDTQAVMIYASAAGTLSGLIITESSGALSFGSPVTIATGTTINNLAAICVKPISSTRFLAAYVLDNAPKVALLNASLTVLDTYTATGNTFDDRSWDVIAGAAGGVYAYSYNTGTGNSTLAYVPIAADLFGTAKTTTISSNRGGAVVAFSDTTALLVRTNGSNLDYQEVTVGTGISVGETTTLHGISFSGFNAVQYFSAALVSSTQAVLFSVDGPGNGKRHLFTLEETVTGLRFYKGVNTLEEKSDLTISGMERGGMLVRANGDVVVATNNADDAVVIEKSDLAVGYLIWDDITGGHEQGRVTSLQEV